MNKKIIFLILFPILILIGVNELSPNPTHSFDPTICTRSCHDAGCQHSYLNLKETWVHEVYFANILWLQKNPLGISYAEMNILIYVILAPILILLFSWGLIRKTYG